MEMLDSQSHETEFRKLSIPSLLTTVFGLLTLTAFFGSSLLVFALVAVFFAIVAWWQNQKEPDAWTGMGYVYVGLAVCAFSIVAVIVHEVTLRSTLQSNARIVAEQWLTLLKEKKPESAYELTRQVASRQFDAKALLKSLETNPDAQLAYDRYLKTEVIEPILASGEKASWEHKENRYIGTGDGKSVVYVIFNVTVHDKEQPRTIPVSITVNRQVVAKSPDPVWSIGNVKIDEPVAKNLHPE
jgi:hypothetical protein